MLFWSPLFWIIVMLYSLVSFKICLITSKWYRNLQQDVSPAPHPPIILHIFSFTFSSSFFPNIPSPRFCSTLLSCQWLGTPISHRPLHLHTPSCTVHSASAATEHHGCQSLYLHCRVTGTTTTLNHSSLQQSINYNHLSLLVAFCFMYFLHYILNLS